MTMLIQILIFRFCATVHVHTMGVLIIIMLVLAAMLFKVELAVQIGSSAVDQTDLPCRWSQNFTKKLYNLS